MPGGLVTVSLFVYYGETSKLVLSGELVTSKFNVKLSASSAQRTPMHEVYCSNTLTSYGVPGVSMHHIGTQMHGYMRSVQKPQ